MWPKSGQKDKGKVSRQHLEDVFFPITEALKENTAFLSTFKVFVWAHDAKESPWTILQSQNWQRVKMERTRAVCDIIETLPLLLNCLPPDFFLSEISKCLTIV